MTSQKKKVALILSGCGFEDGTEIHEAVLTMLALDKAGADYFCFAPDIPQARVYDHFNKIEVQEKRNALVESARIARGKIKPLSKFNQENFDALILPGGFGAASSLCSFAKDGSECAVNDQVRDAVLAMNSKNKPIGALCIAPVILSKIIQGSKVTIGDAKLVSDQIESMGGMHEDTGIGQIVIDDINRIVTAPCYMLNSSISNVEKGITKLINAILDMM